MLLNSTNRLRRPNGRGNNIPPGRISLLKERKEGEEVAAVIFTVLRGSSYDHLFTQIEQESEAGQVLVYQVQAGRVLERIQRVLSGEQIPANEVSDAERNLLNGLKATCDDVGPEAVCFNFECCSGYSTTFGNLLQVHMQLVAFLLKEYGCLVMFSDFSLKALIKDWDAALLGPNPFVQVAEFSGNLVIHFDCNTLKESPSTQLAVVGNLSDTGEGEGSVLVSTMSSTIAYTITQAASNTLSSPQWSAEERKALPYEVEVLTVAKELSNGTYTSKLLQEVQEDEGSAVCAAAGQRGLAGHVMLTYPASKHNIRQAEEDGEEEPVQGRLLTSCGHWIELMKVDTNVKRLLEVAKEQLGETSVEYSQMKAQLNDQTNTVQQTRDLTSKFSNLVVQKSSPAKYKKKRF